MIVDLLDQHSELPIRHDRLFSSTFEHREILPLALDAVIIADAGDFSFSGSNPLRLQLDGRTADIQTLRNLVANRGEIIPPIAGEATMSWSSAPRLNGIVLYDYLTRNHFNVALIGTFSEASFQRVLGETPRAVIISTTFISVKRLLVKLVEAIRRLAPGITIIAGGPRVYMSYLVWQRSQNPEYDAVAAMDEYLFLTTRNEPAVDLYIVSARGEEILREALTRLKQGKSWDDLPNTCRLICDGYRFAKRIDETGPPHQVNWDALPDSIFSAGILPLQASSGCPYRCAFCNFTKDRHLTAIKPLERLLAEMKTAAARGVRYIWFVDDNFRLGKNDLEAVCRRLIQEDVGLRWMTFIRAGTLKNVDVELLRQAGCIEVQLGLESADPLVLKNMNKKASPGLYSEILKKLLSAGIDCSCYFMFGFPGESDSSARRTREFIRRHEFPEYDGMLRWSLFPFLLTPLSPVYEPQSRRRYNLSGYMQQWRHATMDSNQAHRHIADTFLELEHSGPIYRADNLAMLHALPPRQRKQFEILRHRMSKAVLKGKATRMQIVDTFNSLESILDPAERLPKSEQRR